MPLEPGQFDDRYPKLYTTGLPGDTLKPAYTGAHNQPVATLRCPTGICGACQGHVYGFTDPYTGIVYPEIGPADIDSPTYFCVTLSGVSDNPKFKFNTYYVSPMSAPYNWNPTIVWRDGSLNQTYLVAYRDGSDTYSCDVNWRNAGTPVLMYGQTFSWHGDPSATDCSYYPLATRLVGPNPPAGGDPAHQFHVYVGVSWYPGSDGAWHHKLVVQANHSDFGVYFYGNIALPGRGCFKDAPYIVPNALKLGKAKYPNLLGCSLPAGFALWPDYDAPTDPDSPGVSHYPTQTVYFDPVTSLVNSYEGVSWLGVGGVAIVRPRLGDAVVGGVDGCDSFRVYKCSWFYWYAWNCYTQTAEQPVTALVSAECAEADDQDWEVIGSTEKAAGPRILTMKKVVTTGPCDGFGAPCSGTAPTSPAAPTSPGPCPTCPTACNWCLNQTLSFNSGAIKYLVLLDRANCRYVSFDGNLIVSRVHGHIEINYADGSGGHAYFVRQCTSADDTGLDLSATKFLKVSDTTSGGSMVFDGGTCGCPNTRGTSGVCGQFDMTFSVTGVGTVTRTFCKDTSGGLHWKYAGNAVEGIFAGDNGVWWAKLIDGAGNLRVWACCPASNGDPSSTASAWWPAYTATYPGGSLAAWDGTGASLTTVVCGSGGCGCGGGVVELQSSNIDGNLIWDFSEDSPGSCSAVIDGQTATATLSGGVWTVVIPSMAGTCSWTFTADDDGSGCLKDTYLFDQVGISPDYDTCGDSILEGA